LTWKWIEMTLNDGDRTRYVESGNEESKYGADNMTNKRNTV